MESDKKQRQLKQAQQLAHSELTHYKNTFDLAQSLGVHRTISRQIDMSLHCTKIFPVSLFDWDHSLSRGAICIDRENG
eukprot:m.45251 g.45251  ORF g.45251 m.45251 type:complete len:78 (-) comp12166_c0_seq1:949-1182(-)